MLSGNVFGQSKPLDLDGKSCNDLFSKGDGYSGSYQYQKAYDTLRRFIEQCPHDKRAIASFSAISSNAYELVSYRQETSPHFRDWLKGVLYLNSDTIYYCADVIEIARSYLLKDDSSVIYGDEAATVCKYLLDSAHCGDLKYAVLHVMNDLARKQQYLHWQDTVKDSIATPFNPGFTTLDSLGLGILRGEQSGVDDITTPISPHPISEAYAVPNPMKDEVELKYKLTESALVRIEIFDALGKQLYSGAQGYRSQGENTLRLSTKKWASGSYYVRLSMLGGEVKTVKLIKE